MIDRSARSGEQRPVEIEERSRRSHGPTVSVETSERRGRSPRAHSHVADAHRAFVAVDVEHRAVGDAGDPGHAQDGGDAEFSRHDGRVALHGAGVADHRRGGQEERGPCRVGDGTHQHVAGLEPARVGGIGDDPGRSGRRPAADGDAGQRRARRRRRSARHRRAAPTSTDRGSAPSNHGGGMRSLRYRCCSARSAITSA